MKQITLANGYTIATEVQDVTIHDRVGFLDMSRVEQKRVAYVRDANGVYEHGLALPTVDLSLDEDTAVRDIAARIDWLIEFYRKSEEEYRAFVKKMRGKND